jgi:hypothetical protein
MSDYGSITHDQKDSDRQNRQGLGGDLHKDRDFNQAIAASEDFIRRCPELMKKLPE